MFQCWLPVVVHFEHQPKTQVNFICAGKSRINVQHLLESFHCPATNRTYVHKPVHSTNKCSNIYPELHLPIKTSTLLEYRRRFSVRNGCKSLHATHQGIKSSETWGSSVWEMTGYGADDEDRFIIGESDTLFVTVSRPARSTAHPPPFKYGCFLPMKYNSHNVKLITHYHLLPKSRMHAASPPGLPVKIFKEPICTPWTTFTP